MHFVKDWNVLKKTLSFAKSDRFHNWVLEMFIFNHNLEHIT